MSIINVSNATMAREAMATLPEEQRLAFAGRIIAEASSPHSIQQLRRLATSAGIVADDLERSMFVATSLRANEGRV